MTKVKIRICVDCLTADANGSDDESVSLDWPGFEEWLDGYMIGPDYERCADECGACGTCHELSDRWAEGHFSWSRCEGCGSGLGGQRWNFVAVPFGGIREAKDDKARCRCGAEVSWADCDRHPEDCFMTECDTPLGCGAVERDCEAA